MSNAEGGEIEVKEVAEVALLVKSGVGEERHVKVRQGASLLAVVEIIARERGMMAEELVIIREGEDVELALDLMIDADYPHRRRHHVHHRGEVEVVVFYGAKEGKHPFKRRQTIEDVLVWALGVKEFGIDETIASEFELTLHEQKDELPGSERVGHVAGRAKELKLDLVRGDIANG